MEKISNENSLSITSGIEESSISPWVTYKNKNHRENELINTAPTTYLLIELTLSRFKL